MYTQQIRREDVPRNYSGNAFRYPPIGGLTEAEGAGKEPFHSDERSPLSQDLTPLDGGQSRQEKTPSPALPLGGLGGSFGNEEILLVGLVLLLRGGADEASHSRERDLLPYLLLMLLFLG